jgi:hypothetical protein
MRALLSPKYFVSLQLLAILLVQFNLLAPQFARLAGAAPGEEAESCCSTGCCCSKESRRNGTCCCNKEAKGGHRGHLAPHEDGRSSLTSCPCGSSSPFTLLPVEDSFFLASTCARPVATRLHLPLAPSNPTPLRGLLPEPPEPPPPSASFA